MYGFGGTDTTFKWFIWRYVGVVYLLAVSNKDNLYERIICDCIMIGDIIRLITLQTSLLIYFLCKTHHETKHFYKGFMFLYYFVGITSYFKSLTNIRPKISKIGSSNTYTHLYKIVLNRCFGLFNIDLYLLSKPV